MSKNLLNESFQMNFVITFVLPLSRQLTVTYHLMLDFSLISAHTHPLYFA